MPNSMVIISPEELLQLTRRSRRNGFVVGIGVCLWAKWLFKKRDERPIP